MSAKPTVFDYIEPTTVTTDRERTNFVAMSERECCDDQRPIETHTAIGEMRRCLNCGGFR